MFHALSVELISNELTQSDKWNIVSGKYVHAHKLTDIRHSIEFRYLIYKA